MNRGLPCVRRALAAAIVAALGCVSVASGTSFTWVNSVVDYSWSNSANWSPVGVPVGGDDVTINGNSVFTTNVTYDYTGPNVTLNSLNIGLSNSIVFQWTDVLTMSANGLRANVENLGDSAGGPGGSRGTGRIDQSGGTNITQALRLGFEPTDSGVYNLSGTGTLSASAQEEVGYSGAGTFTQSGGTNTTPFLFVGQSSGSTGTYNLNGGSLSAGSIYLAGTVSGPGGTGTGTFTLNTANTLSLSGGMTIYTGGTLTGSGSADVSVVSSGTISPGSSIGVLSLGSVTLNADSRIVLEQDPFNGTTDRLDISDSNGLNLAGTSGIVLSGFFKTPVPLITYSGALGGSVGNLSIYGGDAELAYTPVNDAPNHQITFSARTVADHAQIGLTGQPAPGAGGGIFSQPLISLPVINDAGTSTFESGLVSTSDGSGSGIFSGINVSPVAAARQLQNAPGIGGGTFSDFPFDFARQGPTINASGQVAFEASLTNTIDGSASGIFRDDPASGLTALARDGQAIPNAPGQTLGSMVINQFPALSRINSSGSVAFSAKINNAPDGALAGLFRADGSSLATIARHMETAPGTGGGVFASNFGFENGVSDPPALNDAGQVAFVSQLTGTTDGSTAGIFRGDGNALVVIAREKQALPGAGGGAFGNFFIPLNAPAINSSGQVAFLNEGMTGTSDGAKQGLFRGDGSSLVVIAREKRSAPGGGGGTFDSASIQNFSVPVMNDAGQVGFAAKLAGTTDGSTYGWFRSDGSSLIAIAREKQPAPGTGGGTFVSTAPGTGIVPNPVSIAPGGQVAFVANLTGTPDGKPNSGLFIGDGQETIKAVVTGQVLPTNLTTSFGGPVSGISIGPNAINVHGQIAYQASFSFVGTGFYVFTPILHWRSPTGGSWETTNDWTLGLDPAPVHDVVIDPTIGLTITGPATSRTIKSLTLGTGGAPATLQLGGANVALHLLGPISIDTAGGSKLDLRDGKLITTNPVGTWNGIASAYDGVSGLVASGRNGGAWNGAGITTSSATPGSNLTTLGVAKVGDFKGISDSDTTTFAGQIVTGADTVVMYTYGGDANLDGKINIDDYGRIDGNVGLSGTVFGWFNGNFNYDGKINIDDYGIIDGNIGIQGPPFPTVAQTLAAFADPNTVSAVPEPGALPLMMLASAMPMLCPRRRRQV